MASNFKRATAAVQVEANDIAALLNAGKLQVYDGTQPATADDAVTTQVKLVEFALPNPAFGSADSTGLATANAISDVNALATGAASWFRAVKSDGTKVYDGSVGITGCDLNINSTSIVAPLPVHVVSWTYQAVKA